MMKRMTLLRRRPDVLRDTFSAHWAGPHAAIARSYPGLAKYTQNHVVERLDAAGQDAFATDGMAELWFPNEGAMRSAASSSVTSQLIEDEPRFLDGVTGIILGEAGLDDGVGGAKVIVMGRRRSGAVILAGEAEGLTYASVATVGSTFKRDALWTLPVPPDTIVVTRFVSVDAARAAIGGGVWPRVAGLDMWHAYHVKEVKVVYGSCEKLGQDTLPLD